MRPLSQALGAFALVALSVPIGCDKEPPVDVVGLERKVDALENQATQAIAAQAAADAASELELAASRKRGTSLDTRLESVENEVYALRERVDELERPLPAPSVLGKAPTPGRAVKGTRYRVKLGDAQAKGSTSAKVTIVMFSDFQCPFCGRAQTTLAEVERKFPDDVRFVAKHNPLPFHRDALLAAKATEAAGRQGKFWEMHDLLFKNQKAMSRSDLFKYAKQLRLDRRRFEEDLDGKRVSDLIDADRAQATKLGARGVPAFFVNGRFLSGAQPFTVFAEVIKEEIRAADTAIARGTARSKVYEELTDEGLDRPE